MKVTQSCPTLCGHMDYTVHGILQARIVEWIDFPFSRGSFQPGDRTQVCLFLSLSPSLPPSLPSFLRPFFKSLYWICYHGASVLCFRFFGHESYKTLGPQPGIEPEIPALKGEVLTTRPPRQPWEGAALQRQALTEGRRGLAKSRTVEKRKWTGCWVPFQNNRQSI